MGFGSVQFGSGVAEPEVVAESDVLPAGSGTSSHSLHARLFAFLLAIGDHATSSFNVPISA